MSLISKIMKGAGLTRSDSSKPSNKEGSDMAKATKTKKKAAAKKTSAKKTTAKKAAAKKTTAKKTTAKKVAAKKTAAKKTTAKTAAAKKTAAKKTTAKKAAAKKTAPKKAASKKTTAKKTTAKKVAAKKTAAKKTTAKKAAAKKTTAKKTTVAKAAPKKTAAKKPSPKKTSNKKVVKTRLTKAADGPVVTPYMSRKGESYMNKEQIEHFVTILTEWKSELMNEVDRTVHHMKDESHNLPDPNDRASQEEEFSLELRTRDRERKLIRKIDKTLEAIKNDDFGYCETCGIEIGIRRLEARPTATQCIDCKTLSELKEKQTVL